MKIVIEIVGGEVKSVKADGEALAAVKRGRGRPKKEETEDEETDEAEETDDEEDEAPAPKKRGRPKKVETEDEETEEDDSEDEESDDEEDEADDSDEELEYAEGEDLKKIKAALTAHSKKHKSKDKTVKVLKKFAPSSEKVPVDKVKALLKALKA